MTDIASRFKKTTIPAVEISGLSERYGINPIPLKELSYSADDIVDGLAVEELNPDYDDDNFDWDKFDTDFLETRSRIAPKVLAAIWGLLPEEQKEDLDWEFDFEDYLNEEMRTFFKAREEREEAEAEAAMKELERLAENEKAAAK